MPSWPRRAAVALVQRALDHGINAPGGVDTAYLTRMLILTAIAVVVTALCLLGASCGNSTKDDSAKSPTTGSESKGRGGGEDTRNDFVERPGVPGVTTSEITICTSGRMPPPPKPICSAYPPWLFRSMISAAAIGPPPKKPCG